MSADPQTFPPLDTVTGWAVLASTVRQVNAMNGWAEDFDHGQVPTFLALIHSEITEAHLEAWPLDVAGELADVVIRALDLAELLAPGEVTRQPHLWAPGAGDHFDRCHLSQPAQLLALHADVSAILEAYRKEYDQAPGAFLALALSRLAVLALAAHAQMLGLLDGLPWSGTTPPTADRVIWSKVQKNRTRGFRHGGRKV